MPAEVTAALRAIRSAENGEIRVERDGRILRARGGMTTRRRRPRRRFTCLSFRSAFIFSHGYLQQRGVMNRQGRRAGLSGGDSIRVDGRASPSGGFAPLETGPGGLSHATVPMRASGERYFLRTFGGWSMLNSSVASFPAKSMMAFLPPG